MRLYILIITTVIFAVFYNLGKRSNFLLVVLLKCPLLCYRQCRQVKALDVNGTISKCISNILDKI